MFFDSGGIKPGVSVGTRDELAWKAVDKVYRIRDVHATILHLMGLRGMRLADTGGVVIQEAIAPRALVARGDSMVELGEWRLGRGPENRGA